MKHTYKITGMTCNGCKASVEKNLNALPDVIKASVSLESSEAIIEMSHHIEIETLQNALSDKYSIIEKNVFNPVHETIVASKSDLQQLFPLFLIFGYITIASVLLNIKPWDTTRFMLDFMGLFYIVFSFFKLLDLKGFPESFRMYDPLAKAVPAYARIYPFIEVVLGLMFLMRFEIPIALMATLIILGITTIGVTKALLNKKTIQCACLGTALKLPMTKATFIENSIMIIMAVIMLIKTYN
ncbi:MauE/DoxX family redox-associated membrane protein [Tamlana sp. 2201CG12-4]|uniref:heavy-metal-associated domain-containing protein n=1 Tax=Tamlana sp. 2201CG12-4 TaxID=3112582 RepID=UPI002DBD2026|nr:MauE/DoxX family redox-associated membrane protein [Tamlana sp. 2201CG12-4]MEC3905574.1 MauE/DoxX family redox-associated membrane protein [Tamlana sp. 2201CG12-4]